VYEVVIFDFDGTLVDSIEGIIHVMQAVVEEFGFEQSVLEEWRQLIGVPLFTQMEIILPNGDQALHNEVIQRYRTIYDAGLLEATPLFPDALETLETLKQAGVKMGIVSSKRTIQVDRVLEHLNCRSFFDIVLGAQDVEHHKPHPQGVHVTLEKLSIDKKGAVVIGDSLYDLNMAHNAGVDAIAVATGVHTRETLSTANPRFMVDRLGAVLPIILNNRPGVRAGDSRVVSGDLNTS
jgi:HAD superfamily hydrolase (TIGR01549 family)